MTAYTSVYASLGPTDCCVSGAVWAPPAIDIMNLTSSNTGSAGTVVEGNMIGTNATGTEVLGNPGFGIDLVDVADITIGGTAAGAGNLIAGNSQGGIGFLGGSTPGVGDLGSSDDLIEGNLIGSNAAGTAALGNGGAAFPYAGQEAGIYISDPADPNQNSTGNTIGGTAAGAANLISGNAAPGIVITGSSATANLVEGNLIGTNAAGTAAIGNSGDGVQITGGASGNTIGGTVAGSGNVIAGNSGNGVAIAGSSSTLVAMNWIGTNATGTAKLGNTGDGIYLNQASSSTIGGTTAGAGNLISGNTNGVEIDDSSAILVQGNLIGLDQTGTLSFGNTGAGVLVDAGSSANTIGGAVGGARNEISGNAEGVMVSGSATTGTVVAGNLIGTDVNGIAEVGNLTAGITISGASGTTIGGTTTVARNVISGNLGDGVDLGSGATDTLLEGNYVGTDQTGSNALGNRGVGVSVNGAQGVTIGGTVQSAGNVISGNTQSGLSIQGAATGVAVVGNLIGTDKAASFALGNGSFGVLVSGTPGVTIGGTAAGAGNIVSGNSGAGVSLTADTTGAVVQGNLIGTDFTASNPLGNATGVLISGSSSNNTIGGTATGAGNTIAYSTGIGVDVDATAGTGNAIRLNAIFSNTALGIDLGGDGVTPNTPGGPHTGPNQDQNFPVITGVISAGGTTTVSGTFNSTPSTTFELDFYTLSSTNASGYGEGRYVLGSHSISTDPSGNASFSFPFPTLSGGTQFVTATATDPGGNTSEFSQEFGIDHPPTARIGFTTLTVDEGVAVPFSGTGSISPDGDPLSYSWTFGVGATATGAAPIHTFTTAGTVTVTLTVNDGFGGTNTATATVNVIDVPPVFTPNSFTLPLSFAAPAASDGFGAAVASVNGDVAIAAPSANGSSVNNTGAVYLYDGVPTDDGVSTAYSYGALIHAFADPNPASGDQFGASIAVVGNDLLVGAPGSSISGIGNGAAYLFDANSDSATFGALLATFTLPNPGSTTDAQFGASVSSAGSAVVIGAPGAASDEGAVYEFQGDSTQPSFGSPLWTIPNPDAGVGSQFGAAVSGIGSIVIVGAPSATTSLSTSLGKVYLFDDTTRAELTSISNPDPFTGFGSAVASVGANILIGSPYDGSAGPDAGAAFLYSPAGAFLTRFIQPDGGGGNFGAAVAGTQNTALIGAPGATLGTHQAGAAYLFDAAGASSPTFGQAIAAVQERTPTSGDAFGTAVGFDDGALIVGAPGETGTAGTGAESALLYQPGATLSVSSATTYATAAPNDSVILSGTFIDANPSAALTASIDWGDGSSTTLSLLAGSYAFSAPHDYTTDAEPVYSIGVTLKDSSGLTASAQTSVAISDPAPEFAAPGLVLSSSSIDENGSVTVSGIIVSPGGIHTNTISINWGDGSTDTTVVLPPGDYTFSDPHVYLNNPPGGASGDFAIQASVTDEEGEIGAASTSITVSNVPPQFTAGDLSLSEPIANEGDTITLDGQFTDPGTLDPHSVTIDWGDGSTPTVLYSLFGQIVASTTPGLFTYSVAHQYEQNPPGIPTGGTYDIHVSVSDDVSTTSADTSIVVNEVPPTVQIESDGGGQGSGTITLSAITSNPGVPQTDTVSWTLTEDGTVILTGTGPTFTFTPPPPPAVLVATATATNTDGLTGTALDQFTIVDASGANVQVSPAGISVSVGGTTISTTSLTGSGEAIVQLQGSNDVVDASADPDPIQLIGNGSSETLIGGTGNDLIVAGAGQNSLVGGSGTDTLVSNGGDDTLVGGSGETVYRINPGSDPDVEATGADNILDFSIASLGITLNLADDIGQLQVVDSNGDVVSLNGQFNTYIGSPNGDNITLNDNDDLVYAGAGTNTITGGSGHDSIVGGSGNDIIYAGSGSSTITGGTGNESIVGGTGNDIIYAGSGTSTITGGTGNDSIAGGSGNDIIYAGNGHSTITGGSGSDSIVGGTGNDIIYAGTGTSTITGGGGNDTLIGGTGNDIIYGGAASSTLTGGTGNESIVGGSGNDIIYSGNGNSTITGGSGNQSIVGGTGNDIIYGGAGNATITGGGGNDSIVGGTGNDIIYGGASSSTLTGGTGNESIVGGTGNDIIYAGNGTSTITGGTGNDSIVGGTGNDIIYAGTGNSTITGGGGNDSIVGGTGNDIIYGGAASSTLTGGTGNESIVGGIGKELIYSRKGTNTITGGTGNDSIVGGSGNDIIYAGTGNSTITGGGGKDTLIGGTGNDIIYGGAHSSTLTGGTGNESIVGGTGNDIIYASDGNDTIVGGTGDDTIVGGAGDNIIYGGDGNCSITGGSGSDSILGGAGNDIIYGGLESGSIVGGSGNDTIFGGDLNDTIYGGTGNDTIVGGAGEDSILGGSGDDIIYGGTLTSTLTGGSGNDSIFGSTGNDIIYGGTGNSTITGGTGNQSIVGGTGNDIIYGGPGENTISGGGGDVTISGGSGNDNLTGGGLDSWLMFFGDVNMTLTDTTFSTSGGSSPASVAQISGFENAILAAGAGNYTLNASGFSGGVILQGGTGDDTLIGSSSNDTLIAGAGNDSLVGGRGNDTFMFNGGSSGSQTVVEPAGTNIAGLDFSQAPVGIQINLGQTGQQTVIPGTLNLTLSDPLGISNVLGSPYDDTIIGNARDNTLIGGGGLDEIAGLGGNDLLEGDVTRTVLLDFNTYELPGQHFYTQTERDAIQAQITADYSAFSYVFTQTPPSSGPYTTIYFNDPQLFGLEGGSATGIDWRDVDIAGSATLTATGLQVTAPDTAEVNVNSLLGSPGEPAATSADFVALSATIAAHELGHLSGLEHGDSFGPIGSGIYAGVNPDLYNPPYPGPTDADETVMHIMASGASVNSTLFDAINDPFFGEREAIKLAYGEDGSPTNEQSAPHYSTTDAQPLLLQPLVVPDTDLTGVNADQIFDVTAADVVGYLGLDAAGNSLNDYYSFTAQAGTLINLQVMSAVLNRPQGAFDTTLTVYNSSGQVIAYNDDSFQDTDSTIIDLTLPTTGTYYAMVTSSPKSSALGEPLTGAYELFMYTFATDGDPPAGDTLYAGSGDDTIIAGSADDTIVSSPTDRVLYGSGTATSMTKAPYLDVTAGPNQMVNEGDTVNLTGSYIDPDDADTHTLDWSVSASNGDPIADGTGSTFIFTPPNAGTYTVTFTVSDQTLSSYSATAVVTANAVAPDLTAPAAQQNAVAGETATVNLGTLAVKGGGPWTVTVQWGDGQSSTFLPTGSGPLALAHAYSREGFYKISETVSEAFGDSTSITFPNSVSVVDQPVIATGAPITAIVGIPTGEVIVATFTDPEGADPQADYSASINWGDGQQPTSGMIGYNSTTGVFTVSGAYTYAQPGNDTITVMVTHSSAPTDTTTAVTSSANVLAPVTSTSLLSSSASAVYGQAVTFTATVAGFGTPAGTVTFYSGAVTAADQIGTGTLSVVNGQDQASFSTSSMTVSGSPYAITAVYSGDTVHQGSTSNIVSQTITPAPLTITANSLTKLYGAAVPTLSASYSGFVNSDSSASMTTQPNLSTMATAGSPVASYPITVSGAVDPNYTIKYVGGTLTVTTAALTITAASQSKVYGQVNPALAVSYAGFVNGDSPSSLKTPPTVTTTATTSSPVGTYPITASGAVDPNYTIKYVGGTLTVTTAALTITAANQSKVYGQANPALTVSYAGFVNGDSPSSLKTPPTVTTTATTSSPVGTYPITASGAVDPNYTIKYVGGTLTVTTAALTITAANESKVYGQVNPALTVSYAGFVNGDSPSSLKTPPSVTTTATTSSPVGTYPITASGAVDPNYTIKYVGGTLTVTTAALTITAANESKVYGQVNPALTVSYAGFVNGDSPSSLKTPPSVTTTATTSSPVGTYPITASGAVDPNYTIKYVGGTLTVTTAALTITAASQSKVYGQVNPALAVSYAGFVNGDSPSSLKTPPTVATTATTSSPVGAYPITASGAVDPNYIIKYVGGTLTISKDATTISASASAKSSAFGQSVTFTANVAANAPGSGAPSGSVDFFDTTTGDDLGTVSLCGSAASLRTASLTPGSHVITVSYSGDSNFLTSIASTSTLTINQSVIVLDPSASGALTISGNASIKVAGDVYVDSSSSSALSASGSAQITAAAIDVHGGVQKSGSPAFSPAPITKAASLPDPLAYLPAPSTSGLTNYGSYSLSGNSTGTISPGIYSQIAVSGNASLTLKTGLYIIAGGGFQVSSNASVTGAGVTVYNAGSKFPGNGGTFGAISISGNGTIKLTPSGTGAYAGILFLQPAANTQVLTLSANAMAGVGGTIYAPTAQLEESANAQLNSALVVDTLTLSTNAVTNVVSLAAPAGSVAYTPAQIRSAYGINALSAGLAIPFDGTGQTIAIVDAYDDPSIDPALNMFDSQFGLSAAGPSLYEQYGPASSFLTVLNQAGLPTSLPGTDPAGAGTNNWEVEESLDVEWAHAIAPAARIILVEASSPSLSNLMAGVATAASQPGVSVVSMSWGFIEGQAVSSSAEAAYDSVLTTPGVTFVASTGDSGAADPEYPAFSPNVVAVGGTSLYLDTDGSYKSETSWGGFSNSLGMSIGSGGGLSQYESEPAFQQGVQSTGRRTTPDVSLVADPATGVWIADPYNLQGGNPFEAVGGTSLSAPAWAGLLALVNQGRAASGEPSLNSSSPTETQQALYHLPQTAYNAIANGSTGDSATTVYNSVTGLGTPVANLLVKDLVVYQAPGKIYSSSLVGSLQKATSTDAAPLVVGEMNVFDSLTITSNGLGSLPDPGGNADSNPPALEMPAAIVSNRASISVVTGAGFISGSTPGFLRAGADTSAESAGPSRSQSSLTPLTSTEVVVAPVSSNRIAQPNSPRPVVWSEDLSEGVSPTDSEHPLGLQATRWQDEGGLILATRRIGVVPEWILDDLVSDLAGSLGHETRRASGVPDRPFLVFTGAMAWQIAARPGGPLLAPVPAGPMSRPDRPRQSGRPAASLAGVLMVGGFCGFGAGLLVAKNSWAGSVSCRRQFLKTKTTRLP